MHRLFDILEIVAAILETDKDQWVFLKQCLRVNRLFSHETTRIIWHRCVIAESEVPSLAMHIPTVHALAKIAAHDVSRGQHYANNIRELYYSRRYEQWLDCVSKMDRLYVHLLGVRFPILSSFVCDDRRLRNGKLLSDPLRSLYNTENWTLFWHVIQNSPVLAVLDLRYDEHFTS